MTLVLVELGEPRTESFKIVSLYMQVYACTLLMCVYNISCDAKGVSSFYKGRISDLNRQLDCC